jgi:DNA repair exonuclease SbcCD ATPase subunit
MALTNPVSAATAAASSVSDLLLTTVNKSKEEKDTVQQKYDEAKRQLAMKEADLKNAKEEDKALIDREIAGLRSQVQAMEVDLQQKKDAFAKAQEQLNQQGKIAQNQAASYAKISSDLQKEKIEANASLAGSVVKLKNLDVNKKDLSQAIHSLELTIKTMGKVRTVFENTRLFWEGVKRRCDALTNEGVEATIMADFVEGEMKEEFIASVKNSGFNWLALGKINLVAAIAVETVDARIDGIMNDLPDPGTVGQLIQDLSTTMLAEIEQERVHLENNNNNNNEK